MSINFVGASPTLYDYYADRVWMSRAVIDRLYVVSMARSTYWIWGFFFCTRMIKTKVFRVTCRWQESVFFYCSRHHYHHHRRLYTFHCAGHSCVNIFSLYTAFQLMIDFKYKFAHWSRKPQGFLPLFDVLLLKSWWKRISLYVLIT